MVKPSASIVAGFRSVSVETLDGDTLTGLARNHSNYSIQMIDLKDNLHLLLREDLPQVSYKPGAIMPTTSLSEEDLLDLDPRSEK